MDNNKTSSPEKQTPKRKRCNSNADDDDLMGFCEESLSIIVEQQQQQEEEEDDLIVMVFCDEEELPILATQDDYGSGEPEPEADNFFKPLENEVIIRGKTMFFPNVPRLDLRGIIFNIEERKCGPWTLLVGEQCENTTTKSLREIVQDHLIRHDIFIMASSRGCESLHLPFKKDTVMLSFDPHNVRMPTSFHIAEGMGLHVEASVSINLSPKGDVKDITLKVKRVVTQETHCLRV